MDKCPICKTIVSEKNQDYCLKCAWEFEYYFDELKEKEKKRYRDRLEIYQIIYSRSLLEAKEIDSSLVKEEIVTVDDLMYQNQPFIKEYTWEEAKEYAKNLRLGGHDDWRLPTRVELKKIMMKKGEHYRETYFKENMPELSWFWTVEERDSSSAWYIRFFDEHVAFYDKLNYSYVLCVR